jgi:hypothetical protein
MCNLPLGVVMLPSVRQPKCGGSEVQLEAVNQIVIPPEMFRRRSAVRELAELAIILGGNVGGDHLAFG